MKIISSIEEWRKLRREMSNDARFNDARFNDVRIGFVPTMGNLHLGHASLLEKSKKDNTISVLSIFVNPTQFNDTTDYDKYPRTLEGDIEVANANGVDYILLPQEKEIYPDGYRYQIIENEMSKILEGKYRAHHFEGVLTIVMKLLMLVKPHKAYFGMKDYQQYELVKGMVDAFFCDIEIVGCDTIRAPSGLAMSSRNSRLNDDQLKQSALLSHCLSSGETEAVIKSHLEQHGFEVEYVEKWKNRLLAAVRIGDVRLIDNVEIQASYSLIS